MSADDPRPPGALETAVTLFDELMALSLEQGLGERLACMKQVADLERRRAALQPRLDRRRENQAKPRGGKP